MGASSHTSRRRLWRSALSGSSSPRAERSAAACDLAARLTAVGKFFLRSWRHLQQWCTRMALGLGVLQDNSSCVAAPQPGISCRDGSTLVATWCLRADSSCVQHFIL